MGNASSPNFSAYRTVGEAAAFLGVTTTTLRNWDRTGKLKPRRHPQNGYRIYLHEDLEAVLRSAEQSLDQQHRFAPAVDWSQIGEREHFVQFYETDEYLVNTVSGFVAAVLTRGGASLVIATAEHRIAIQRKLAEDGIDLSEAIEAGRYLILDAAETLARFLVDGSPDAARFHEVVGGVVSQLAEGGRPIHAFGEMVALLWEDGNREAALCLEALWNELAQQYRFALCCAYPLAGFGMESDGGPLSSVCRCHSRVFPAESYALLDDADERLETIALLQQKSNCLEAEVAHRSAAEQALLRRERELADFLENSIEGLHKVGPDGRILWANRAELAMLGYAWDEYVGRPIAQFHVDQDVIEGMLERLLCGGSLVNQPARIRCKDGSIKHVLVNSNGCFEGTSFLYSRCFTRDVTDIRQAEDALREADRRKDEFLATLAHELRNPLAPLRNGVELLRLSAADPELAREARSIMERQVEQMTRLVDDLLDVSRITQNKIELRKQRLLLADIVNSAVETSRSLIDAGGHELTIALPSEAVALDADPTRMTQIFSNLLNNSARYTNPGGRISLKAEVLGREVGVTVEDNGIGIPCDALAYVFDMFRQADRSIERSRGGLGIGLTLVRRLVELHGGTIIAQSEGAGKGSAFTVRLPIVSVGDDERERRPGAESSRLCQRRILVVDDNPDSVITLSKLLTMRNNEVRTAGNGLEAVEVAADFRPEIVLMDVGMPELNGLDATRRLRQTTWGRDIFIVALSGWGQAEDRQRSVDAGCSAHLTKPVDFTVLEQLLASRPQ